MIALPARPPIANLSPPKSFIYLTRTHVLARALSRQLVSIKLAAKLALRPSAADVVTKGILPTECCAKDRSSGEYVVRGGRSIDWGLLPARRELERERVRDSLREWVAGVAVKVVQERGREAEIEDEAEGQIKRYGRVKSLVRRFTRCAGSNNSNWEKGSSPGASRARHERLRRRSKARVPWGRPEPNRDPTRAYVLSMRKFWENMAGKGPGTTGAMIPQPAFISVR